MDSLRRDIFVIQCTRIACELFLYLVHGFMRGGWCRLRHTVFLLAELGLVNRNLPNDTADVDFLCVSNLCSWLPNACHGADTLCPNLTRFRLARGTGQQLEDVWH